MSSEIKKVSAEEFGYKTRAGKIAPLFEGPNGGFYWISGNGSRNYLKPHQIKKGVVRLKVAGTKVVQATKATKTAQKSAVDLQVAIHSDIGHVRKHNEDVTAHVSKDSWHVVGVFDGHGGVETADIVAANLPEELRVICLMDSKRNAISNSAIQRCFVDFDEKMCRKPFVEQIGQSGSTATCLCWHVPTQTIVSANVGDSRTIVFDAEGNILLETRDHKPEDKNEAERIERAGGKITKVVGEPFRVNDSLSMSRSFGDFSAANKRFKHGHLVGPITAEPDVIQIRPVTATSLWAVLASDGLWDVLTVREVVDHVLRVQATTDPKLIVQELVSLALSHKKCEDNVTAVVIKC